jgi:predicted metalloprotease
VELKDDEDEAEYQSFRKVEEEDFNYGSSASDSEYASAGFTTGKMDEDGNIVSDAPAFEEGSLELDSDDDFE